MKQMTVTLNNKPGELAKLCEVLGKKGINISSLFGGGFDSDKGLVHLITEDINTATRAFAQSGYEVATADVMTLKLPDRPGELGKLTRKLAHAHVNINSIYVLSRERGETTLVLDVDNREAAERALK